ncbi:hypothetical protein ACPA1U_11140, partial [Ectopseudomonas hydrolytica]
ATCPSALLPWQRAASWTRCRLIPRRRWSSVRTQLCRQQMEELGAHCLPLGEPQVTRRVGLLHQAGHQLSSAAQALSDTLLRQAERYQA